MCGAQVVPVLTEINHLSLNLSVVKCRRCVIDNLNIFAYFSCHDPHSRLWSFVVSNPSIHNPFKYARVEVIPQLVGPNSADYLTCTWAP